MDLKKKIALGEPGPNRYDHHLRGSIEYHNNKLKGMNQTQGFNFNF